MRRSPRKHRDSSPSCAKPEKEVEKPPAVLCERVQRYDRSELPFADWSRLACDFLRRHFFLRFVPALFAEVLPRRLGQQVADKDRDYHEQWPDQDRRLLECFEASARSYIAANAPIIAPQASPMNLLGSAIPPTEISSSMMPDAGGEEYLEQEDLHERRE